MNTRDKYPLRTSENLNKRPQKSYLKPGRSALWCRRTVKIQNRTKWTIFQRITIRDMARIRQRKALHWNVEGKDRACVHIKTLWQSSTPETEKLCAIIVFFFCILYVLWMCVQEIFVYIKCLDVGWARRREGREVNFVQNRILLKKITYQLYLSGRCLCLQNIKYLKL